MFFKKIFKSSNPMLTLMCCSAENGLFRELIIYTFKAIDICYHRKKTKSILFYGSRSYVNVSAKNKLIIHDVRELKVKFLFDVMKKVQKETFELVY